MGFTLGLIRSTITPAYKTPVTNTLYRCNDNNWCCSASGNTTSCCNDPNVDLFTVGHADIFNGSAWPAGYILESPSAVAAAAASSSSLLSLLAQTSTLIMSASIPTNSPTPTAIDKLNSNDNNNNNETKQLVDGSSGDGNGGETRKVGLAMGLGIGIPLLAALLGVTFMLRREKRAHQALRQQVYGGYAHVHAPALSEMANSNGGGKGPYERMTRQEGERVTEMPTEGAAVSELYDDRGGRR